MPRSGLAICRRPAGDTGRNTLTPFCLPGDAFAVFMMDAGISGLPAMDILADDCAKMGLAAIALHF